MSRAPTGDSRVRRFILLTALYFSQGLPYGFFTQALPAILREQGTSLPDIGLANLLALPWALKFLWAPYLETPLVPALGRRRSWLLALQAATATSLLAFGLAPSLSVAALLVAVLWMNFLAATQDVPADGFAVDALAPEERGIGNAIQVGGYRIGMIVGGGALLMAHGTIGLSGIFLAMSALVALASIPVLSAQEPPTHLAPATDPPGLRRFLRRPDARRILALCLTYKLGESFGNGMLRPFLTDHGYRLEDLGWVLGTVGFGAGLAGALVGGALVRPLGRRRSLVLFGLLQAAAVLGFAWLSWVGPNPARVAAVAAAEHFASGMATAALFTAMMDFTRRDASATEYTVQASAVVIAQGIGAALSGVSAQALGYTGHFVAAAGLCLAAMGAVWLVLADLDGPTAAPGDAPS